MDKAYAWKIEIPFLQSKDDTWKDEEEQRA